MHFTARFNTIWHNIVALFDAVVHRTATAQGAAKLDVERRLHHVGSQPHKGDPTLLGDKEAVSFRTSENYLGITERQRQKLMRKGVLQVIGGGQNRKITTESLRRYLPPREKPN